MTVREMTPSDVAAVARCQVAAWQQAFRGIFSAGLLDGLSVQQFSDTWTVIMTRTGRTNLVAESQGEVLGFVAFGPPTAEALSRPGVGEILGIYVHPDHWRTGAGGELLTAAIARLSGTGCRKIIVWTMADNSVSRRFYEKHGMKPTGRSRVSEREAEPFEEVEYSLEISPCSRRAERSRPRIRFR